MALFCQQWQARFWRNGYFSKYFLKGLYQQADNMAAQMNSPADDFFFYPKKGHSGGFFISNRLWGSQKTGTEEQDIYEITY